MLGLVKDNKIIPLTTDTGTGAPIGTLIQQYKKKPMSGYLYCDGSTFDENAYPALYMYLGTNVLPDYRECVMVGAEQKAVYVYIKATSGLAENQQDNVLNDVKEYISPSLVYNTDKIDVYRQVGTYTFQFRGCSLVDYQTAISTVLNAQSLPHQWVTFISRRDAGNNDVYPGTVVVSTDLYVTGWYSNSSGVETQMSMDDRIYGIATIIVTEE